MPETCLQPVRKYWVKASVIYYVLIIAAIAAAVTGRYAVALSAAGAFLFLSLVDFALYRIRTRTYQELDRLYFSGSPEVERLEDRKWLRKRARKDRAVDTEYEDRWEMASRHIPRFRRIGELVSPMKGVLIEAGCGAGKLIAGLSGRHTKKIIGFDVMRVGHLVRQRAPDAFFVQALAEEAPFRDGVADVVVCSEVLEHLRDPERALRECYRLLRPQGVLIASVPNAAILPETINPFVWLERALTPSLGVRRGHKPHAVLMEQRERILMTLHKLYDRSEFLALLDKAPFRVEHVECAAFALGPLEFPFRVLRKAQAAVRGRPAWLFDMCFRIYCSLARAANRILPGIPILKNMGVVILVVARRTG